MDQPTGTRTQKALRWVASELALRPEARRMQLLQEAAQRFDLTPMETDLLMMGKAEPAGETENPGD